MKSISRISVPAALFVLCGTTYGEVLDSSDAMERLTENTWSGKNESGRKFWFYHRSNGKAYARFEPGYGDKNIFSAEWEITAGGKICWEWDYGERNCYVRFEIEDNELSMTRTDGVVHSGRLEEGNTEGL